MSKLCCMKRNRQSLRANDTSPVTVSIQFSLLFPEDCCGIKLPVYKVGRCSFFHLKLF